MTTNTPEEEYLRRTAYIELTPGAHFAAAELVLGRVPTVDHIMDLFFFAGEELLEAERLEQDPRPPR